MIPPASRRSRTASSSAGAPRASSAISRRNSPADPLAGAIGIGHTRWATHGKPTETNAHPHASRSSPSCITASSRTSARCARSWPPKAIASRPRRIRRSPRSSSRTNWRTASRPIEAVHAALERLRGAFALVYLFEGEDNLSDRRAAGRAARCRLRRGRNVPRLRRARARALHRPHRLSRGGRLGRR